MSCAESFRRRSPLGIHGTVFLPHDLTDEIKGYDIDAIKALPKVLREAELKVLLNRAANAEPSRGIRWATAKQNWKFINRAADADPSRGSASFKAELTALAVVFHRIESAGPVHESAPESPRNNIGASGYSYTYYVHD